MNGKLAIAGGGPAGMMAAIKAAGVLGDGSRIVIFDKNERLGRKIYLTGKGRCNFTNRRRWEEFSTHIHPDQGFLRFAFRAFSNEDLIAFFENELGLETVTLQGQRVFPASLSAGDVARALEAHVRSLGVDIRYGTPVSSLEQLNGFGAVIIATGGLSYPVTGSTGDGYRLAREAGHSIATTFPSETALMPFDYDRSLSGLTLKNVGLRLSVDGNPVQYEEGEFTFTDDGLESGIAYRLSRRAVWALTNGQRIDISLDLKPSLTEEQLTDRLGRAGQADSGGPGGAAGSFGSKRPRSAQKGSDARWKSKPALNASALKSYSLLPAALIDPFLRSHPGLAVETLPAALKSWTFRIEGFKGYERAVVTAGGVSLKEIVPKTMASRLRPGLYFCGEVMDLDGDTGGYNLQIAFSSGALAGTSAAAFLLSLPK